MTFEVFDRNTGKPADLNLIRTQILRCQHAGRNFWAEHLIYCDLAEWVIDENGTLALTDDCGNVAYPPSKRYYPVFYQEEGDIGMALGIIGLTVYLIVATRSVHTAMLGFTSLVVVGSVLALPMYLVMRNRAEKLKHGRFVWRTGTVIKTFRGRRGKAYVIVDERFNECFPFAPLKAFGIGETVFVIRFSDNFGHYVFKQDGRGHFEVPPLYKP